MKITDKIAEKVAGALGWLLLKELRRIATALEKGIDSHREIHGFHPLFAVPPATQSIDQQIQDEQDAAVAAREILDASPETEGDFMRLEILEMLARENRIEIDTTTDLVALGKERGWLDQAGEIVMLPQGYGQ